MQTVVQTEENTEFALIRQAQQGDRSAYSELVLCYRARVVNVVYRMCGDPHLAEDAAQEAFIRAWQKLPSYKPTGAFHSWLYRIATNVALDALRRRKPTVDIEDVVLPGSEGSPEASYATNERAERVQQAVLALPPASRAALILREYEGLSYQEIADSLDIPIGTVMSRLSYARKALMETLAEYMEKP